MTMDVIVNDMACIRQEYKQVRFPASKKKRIRAKWAKRSSNYKYVETHQAIRIGNTLVISTKAFKSIQQTQPTP